MTIRELASQLQVSHAAVSYALNGKPGVSEETRTRILHAASIQGWQPSVAARALSGQGSGSIGLVISGSIDRLAGDSFYLAFIAGVQAGLMPRGLTITFQVVDSIATECEVYRRWAAELRVDGVVLVDPRRADPRIPLVQELGLPAVLVGTRRHRSLPIPVVWADDHKPMVCTVERLAELGHTRIGHISGPAPYLHTGYRAAAYDKTMAKLKLEALPHIYGEYNDSYGAQAMQTMIERGATAVICDNDQLAVGAMRQATQRGLRIPKDMSIVSWEDSMVSRSTYPQLTTIHRDPVTFGTRAAKSLLAAIDEQPVEATEAESAELIERGSTGPAPTVKTPSAKAATVKAPSAKAPAVKAPAVKTPAVKASAPGASGKALPKAPAKISARGGKAAQRRG